MAKRKLSQKVIEENFSDIIEVVAYEGHDNSLLKASQGKQPSLTEAMAYPLTFMIAEGGYIFEKTEEPQTYLIKSNNGIDEDYLNSLCEVTGMPGEALLKSVLVTRCDGQKTRIGRIQNTYNDFS